MVSLASAQLLGEQGLSRGECLALVLEQEKEQVDLIQRLEIQLSVARQSLRSLRSTANTLRLPSLLPDELLADIMSLTYGFDYRDEGFQVDFWRPIWLSHVSGHWRRVALATPSLWSTIPLANPDIRDLFLSRKGHALMDAKLLPITSLSMKACSTIAQVLQEHAGDLRSIQLKLNDRHDLLAIVQRFAVRPLPQLLHLRLETFSQVEDPRLSRQLFHIFNTAPPSSLRRVNFLFVPIPLASHLLRGGELRYLKIASQNFVDIHELLEVFSINSHLVELYLIDLRLVSNPTDLRRQGLVELRALELMVIENVPKVLKLLRSITTSGSISITGNVEKDPELAELLLHQNRSFHSLPAFEDDQILSIFVRHRAVRSTDMPQTANQVEFSISLYRVAFMEDVDEEDRDPPCLQLNLVHPISGPWSTLLFHSLGETRLPLTHLEHLHFYGVHSLVSYGRQHSVDQGLWDAMFSALSSLRALVLDRSTFGFPMVSLTEPEEGTGALRCPHLQSISITLTSLMDSALESPPDAASEGFTSLVLCVLKRRARSIDSSQTSDGEGDSATPLQTLSVRLLKDEGQASKDHAVAFMGTYTRYLDALARRVVCHCEEGMEGDSYWKWEF